MFLADPPPTQADLHFRLFGFSVRVHPFFWVMALILGLRDPDPVRLLTWIAVVFISILVHELGHALAIRRYGGHARIVLHSFGGLAIEEQADRSPKQQIVISLAGPAAGFVLAAAVVAFLAATGRFVAFKLGLVPIDYVPPQNALLDQLVWDLLVINCVWGLINLLPIYPLDGGQISRELFLLGKPQRGIILSLWTSMITAAAVAVFAVIVWQPFMAILFGFLAYSSYQTLQAYMGHRRTW